MRVDPINQAEVDRIARSAEVKRHTEGVANALRDEAAKMATVGTGRLRRSLIVEDASGPRGVEFRVGWDKAVAPYGPLVELGTEDTPARPHLRPAARKVGGV